MQNLVYNLPILYLAYRVFGRLYAVDTIFGTVALSVILDATHFLVDWSICADPMLNSIFGGVLAGVGFGMVFRANANTGGLDVIAAVTKKYYSLDVGTVVFILNFLIIMGSVALFGMEVALFSIVSIYVTAELTNRVAAGLNREKSIFIVSPQARHLQRHHGERAPRCDVHRRPRRFRRGAEEHPVRRREPHAGQPRQDHRRPPRPAGLHDRLRHVGGVGQGFTLACESYEDARRKWQQTHEKQLEFEQLHGKREK